LNETLYRQLAEIEDKHWWLLYRRKLVRDFLSRLDIRKDRKGLDIGCGTGGNLPLLRGYCSSVTGMDLSEYALSLARKKHPDYDCINGDANNLSDLFGGDTFGLATVFNVLHHRWIDDEIKVLKQVYNILEPGGYLIITEPAFNILMRKHDRQALTKHRYRVSAFNGFLREAGFDVISSTYFGSVFFIPAFFISVVERVRGLGDKPVNEKEQVSELSIPAEKINACMLAFMDLERTIIRVVRKLPVGIGFLCVAQKSAIGTKK